MPTCQALHRGRAFTALAPLFLAGVLSVGPSLAWASPSLTPAGATIDNVAQVTLRYGDAAALLFSNRASFQVHELVDVHVDVLTPEIGVEPNQSDQVLDFLITNIGNGDHAFDVEALTIDRGFSPSNCQLIVDWNGDGILDRSTDRVSAITPVLAPQASVKAWASCNIPASAEHNTVGHVHLKAFSRVLGNDEIVGAMSASAGGGSFIIKGRNLRAASAAPEGGFEPAAYRVGRVDARVIKSQTVEDAFGGSRAQPGSVITYSLEAVIGPGLPARDTVIKDPIPRGATYVEGSLTLDGEPLSDAEDSDVGRATGAEIEVALGDLPPDTRRLVTFKVRIDQPPL